jgi:multicomponent Na+:H+ antiporter subunit G
MEIIKIIGAFFVLAGALFIFISSIGLVRMPDSLSRIQAGTKASTLGTMLSLLGIGLIHLDWIGKIIAIIIFVILTNPVSSHVLARAVYSLKKAKNSINKTKNDD